MLGYFPSTAIKIWALVDLNIPHNACMLTITPLLTRARNIQLKKDTVLPTFNVFKYINIFRNILG